MEVEINTKLVAQARKAEKMTQAAAAAELKVSLRTYSKYEDPNSKFFIGELELHRLANALSCNEFQLWAKLPKSLKTSCFYYRTSKISRFAEYVGRGYFDELLVSGLPIDTSLREPLIALLKLYEDAKHPSNKDEMQSEAIKRQFLCKDLLDSFSSGADFPPEFLVMNVPLLKISEDWIQDHDGLDANFLGYKFKWIQRSRALIDFNIMDPETRPETINLIPNFAWIFDRASKEEWARYEDEALAAREQINFAEEIKTENSEKENDQELEKEKDDGM